MLEFVALILKPYSYLTDDGDENGKRKRSKKMCHKTKSQIQSL